MAVESIGYRKGAIAISAGLGVALPLAAYAASLPFDGVNEAIRPDILPLAVGSLAGVCMLAISGHLMDARAERLAEEQSEADRFRSVFSDTRSARSTHAPQAGSRMRGHRSGKPVTPQGVPVISRAVDALDEAEAWAEIDAMFSGDSPFSCDPARSKDMYQIALEELRRTDRVKAQETARASTITADECEDVIGRDEAMASLYGSAAARTSGVPVLPKMQPTAAPVPAPSMQAAASARAEDVEVPMADYSGHEGMWARALAILAEEGTPGLAQGDRTVCVGADRMAALAEGGNATKMHARVNAMIEDEFDKVESKSVHAVAHEYLKVIEGGTAALDARQLAEA